MAAGLRATAKAGDHPPEPNVGAPVLDPTADAELPLVANPRSIRDHPTARGKIIKTLRKR
jgi:hypothetical protein